MPGKVVELGQGRRLLLPAAKGHKPRRLVIHFHGAGWVAEQAARARYKGDAAILTVDLSGASSVYRASIAAEGSTFGELVSRAEEAAGVKFGSIVLSSFSAGYGAIREILRERANWDRVHGVVLADSMHAGYGEEEQDIGPFVEFAKEAAAGRKQFVITHSEVFPGTYMSTTETAGYVLQQLGLKRRAVLEWGPLGMQQVCEVHAGGLRVLGFAGNSAPDHMDHLFALERWYGLLRLQRVRR
ncbi:hypothetical protein F183_A22660 [Bryobacterales bacterium F-183]|nr:hypothetical protein F183_A22660 [Bryobacterales bacterium F-183]